MTTEACESAILTHLSSSENACIEDTYPWAIENGFDPQVALGAVKSLLPEQMVATADVAVSFYVLSPEGESILENGTQEILVLKALNEAGKLSIADLEAAVGKEVAKIGMGNCMKNKWIQKDGGDLVAVKKMEEVEDSVQICLKTLKDGNFAENAVDAAVSLAFNVYVVPINSHALLLLADRDNVEKAKAGLADDP
jgi:phenylalanyl-tRNA synthetase alpha chain